jgi:CubicO group peptidase (beta-lactamase class C family)
MKHEDQLVFEPEAAGLDPVRVMALLQRAEREVLDGVLPSMQMAIARNGRIGAMRTVGIASLADPPIAASNHTIYPIFSCTKAIVAAAVWLLIGDGMLDVSRLVASYVPEFAAGGKSGVKVEHLLTHSAGFPRAGMTAEQWADRRLRIERFQSWRLEWPPGSRFVYHPTATFWVLAEIIERLSGMDFRDFIRRRVSEPLGLACHVGLEPKDQVNIASLTFVGEPPADIELERLGISMTIPAVAESAILSLNDPAIRAVGVPGGGGLMTAATIALFYQALLLSLANDAGLWRREVLAEALRIRSPEHRDPILGCFANRALGVIIAGSDGHAALRGFGAANSEGSFGHGGAGGQLGWADPATGISFAYLTNGIDRDFIRQGRRSAELSNLAAQCAA